MKFIQLTDDDITELKNIINCLTSKDKEVFELGKSLLEVKFGVDFLIPIMDMFVPFKPYYDRIVYPNPLSIDLNQDWKLRLGLEALEWLIKVKCYVTL